MNGVEERRERDERGMEWRREERETRGEGRGGEKRGRREERGGEGRGGERPGSLWRGEETRTPQWSRMKEALTGFTSALSPGGEREGERSRATEGRRDSGRRG